MNKTFIINIYISALIVLFLSLPAIAIRNVFTQAPKSTPAVILREDGHPSMAQFKSYDENLMSDSLIINVKKVEPTPISQPEITPAVQSIALSIEDVQSSEPTPTPIPVDTSNSPKSLNEEQIQFLGRCEAGMDPTKNTGNGYYGAFQFSYGTWQSMNTGYERADMAPLEVQIDAVQRLLQRSSIYTQFPACARQMQSQGLI